MGIILEVERSLLVVVINEFGFRNGGLPSGNLWRLRCHSLQNGSQNSSGLSGNEGGRVVELVLGGGLTNFTRKMPEVFSSTLAVLAPQGVVSKVYPAPLSLTTIMCFFASLQSSFLALFLARNPSSWRLQWNVQLLTIVYFGVLNTALVYYLQAWCISHKGPVFAAMFTPLPVVLVAVFSAIAFAERLHFGSLIGALLIIVGLYCVLWGKRKDGLVGEHTEIEKVTVDDNKVVEIYMSEISVVNPVTKGET
ncbi:WAT1-related protein At5g64700-like [Malus sylvestris]|uniref:WAT1-related protein At5g64700-like n=1 Tax=Malus sylvestris TaxID=3752 RepID=UPI0021AC8AEE|nr:WAT1-related protein At5g64700-like [Malus sylvestris]